MMRQLILEDGTVFVGEGFGSEVETTGEIVFTTGMTGYQEVLTDPSYCGQIVTFTFPLVGNYGINLEDFESIVPAVHGLIVKEYAEHPSNFRNKMSLDQYCKDKGIPGLAGIDTRMLTKKLREVGTMKGKFCSMEANFYEVVAELTNTPLFTNHVERVSTQKPYRSPGRGHRVVLVDFGMKHGILRELTNRKCDVTVVPYNISAKEIFLLAPDGIMLSNGPGDPKDVQVAIEMIKEVVGKVPLFGICLGHQLFALANGGNTSKLKFGHRGMNHPVKHLETGKVAITSQNHGYAVEMDSIEGTDLEVTHVALNDGTVEGLKHKIYPAFTVQYHPEASPGPEDANYLFDEFMSMMEAQKREGNLQCQNA
jgi:carbamoyl-phosphate synthase small subunit